MLRSEAMTPKTAGAGEHHPHHWRGGRGRPLRGEPAGATRADTQVGLYETDQRVRYGPTRRSAPTRRTSGCDMGRHTGRPLQDGLTCTLVARHNGKKT